MYHLSAIKVLENRLGVAVTAASLQTYTLLPWHVLFCPIFWFYFCFQDAAIRKDKFTGYRLMTSVSIPVFDKKNHTVRLLKYFTMLRSKKNLSPLRRTGSSLVLNKKKVYSYLVRRLFKNLIKITSRVSCGMVFSAILCKKLIA